MKANERAYRRMMKSLKLRDCDLSTDASPYDMIRGQMAASGLQLAIALDGTLEPRDRVAAVRELRQLTEKLMEATAPGGTATRGAYAVEDDDDWDTPSAG